MTFKVIWPSFRFQESAFTLLLYNDLGRPRSATRPKRALVLNNFFNLAGWVGGWGGTLPENIPGWFNVFIRPSLDGTYYGMALSVRPSVRPTVSTKKHRCKWRIFFKFCTQVCLGVPSINLLFVLSYLIKYAHNSIISDFSILGIPRVIF